MPAQQAAEPSPLYVVRTAASSVGRHRTAPPSFRPRRGGCHVRFPRKYPFPARIVSDRARSVRVGGVPGDRLAHGCPCAPAVPSGVVRRRQPEPYPPIVRRSLGFGSILLERRIGGCPIDPSGGPSRADRRPAGRRSPPTPGPAPRSGNRTAAPARPGTRPSTGITSTATPRPTATGSPVPISSTPRQPSRAAYATKTTASTIAACFGQYLLPPIAGQARSMKCSSPTVSPGAVDDAPDAEQDTGHERHPSHRVVPDREGLALVAEQHLLVRDQPAQPDAVHADPLDVSAAGTVERRRGRVRDRRRAGFATSLGDQIPPYGGLCRTGASTLSGWCSSMISTDS